MNTLSSVSSHQNYNEAAELRREKLLQLKGTLLTVEDDRADGRNGCTIDELDSFLENILNIG